MWLFPERNVQLGNVVLVVDPGTPIGSWPPGRVPAVFPDKKGLIRSVEIKTTCITVIRPVHYHQVVHGLQV